MDATHRSDQEWRPVVGYEGAYEVSEYGDVRTVPRVTIRRDGKPHSIPGRMRRPHSTARNGGHLCIGLIVDKVNRTHRIHVLVAEAFIGPRPLGVEGEEIRHLDGNPLNNHVSNLRYGTRSENQVDAVEHGTNTNARKTHCAQGHPFADDNLYVFTTKANGRQRRACKTCMRAADRRFKARRAQREGGNAA